MEYEYVIPPTYCELDLNEVLWQFQGTNKDEVRLHCCKCGEEITQHVSDETDPQSHAPLCPSCGTPIVIHNSKVWRRRVGYRTPNQVIRLITLWTPKDHDDKVAELFFELYGGAGFTEQQAHTWEFVRNAMTDKQVEDLLLANVGKSKKQIFQILAQEARGVIANHRRDSASVSSDVLPAT